MGATGSKPDFKELSKGTKFTTKELNEWFKKFKADFPDGKINQVQFIRLYQAMFESDSEGDATEFCGHVFRQYDRDGNGSIDFREFVTTLSVASRGSNEEKLKWAFKLYDLDGNGYLSRAEITEILTSIYKSRNQSRPSEKAAETTRDIFIRADDNGDGKLSEAEFIQHSGNTPSVQEMLQSF